MIASDGTDHALDSFVFARFFRKTGVHPRFRGDMLFLIALYCGFHLIEQPIEGV
jgi:hypothetical protein